MAFVLSIDNARGETDRILVRKDAVLFGRGQDNDVILKTPLASRHHCRVFSAAGRTMIEDLDSQNGTYVLDERVVGARELLAGEPVRVPGYVVRLESDAAGQNPGETPSRFDRVISNALPGSEPEASVNHVAGRKGFSPLVSYGGGKEAEELARQADEAFSHKQTETVMRPSFVSDHQLQGAFDSDDLDTNENLSDTDADDVESFAGDEAKTNPSQEAFERGRPHARSSSNAAVPVDARELRASLFDLFARAVKRSGPPKGKDGREQLREKVEHSIPRDDTRLTHLETQAWAAELVEELCGYGPLTALLANPNVTSVVVEGVNSIRIQRGGQLVPVGIAFTSSEALALVMERILEEAGVVPEPSDATQNFRLPSGLEIVVHKTRDDVAPFTVVKPIGDKASGIEKRLQKRAEEVAEAIARR